MNRIREDSLEALPIIARIDQLTAMSEEKHKHLCPDLAGLIHPSDLLDEKEKEELHQLKMQLRPKSREEARADLARRRANRTLATGQ